MAQSTRESKRLVVVPSDPLRAYVEKGRGSLLQSYYNPDAFFDEVILLSPLEEGERNEHGMRVIGASETEIKRRLRELRPDVIRAYGGYWAADLACRKRDPWVPVVVSVHDTNPALLYPAVRYADLVVCMSNAVAERVAAFGVDRRRVRILPNRIDENVFRPVTDGERIDACRRQFPQGRMILCVGRASKEKNRTAVIQSLCHLPDHYFAVFVGRGDRQSEECLAVSFGVAHRCHFVESVPNEELAVWYSMCDCLCNPSRWEGFGIVFIEAAACGTPVVTSNLAPMNELLTHLESAYLVDDYENGAAVAEAILAVCENRDLRRKLSSHAVEAARPFWKIGVDAREVEIYREALGMAAPPLSRRLSIRLWQGLNQTWVRRLRCPRRLLLPMIKQFLHDRFPFLIPIVHSFRKMRRSAIGFVRRRK